MGRPCLGISENQHVVSSSCRRSRWYAPCSTPADVTEELSTALQRLPPPLMVAGSAGYALGDLLGGTYELRELIASSHDHDLFGAYDQLLGRDVAIKIVSDQVPRDHLRREARMLAPLTHPGLPVIFGYGYHGRCEYLVCERLYGTTLSAFRDMRAERGGFAPHEAISILIGIADALAVMHANGYVHGRLTADSVILARDGRIVVRDPIIVGEVVPGEGGDARTDLSSLGFLAYELFTGEFWAGENIDAVTLPPEPTRVLAELLPTNRDQLPRDAGVVAAFLRSLRRTPDATTSRLKIVIADDDEAVRALLVLSLQTAAPHAEVYEAADGTAAIELVERHRPELLLLDLEMPRLDGIGVCQFLRGTNARDHLAICVMSKHAASNRPTLARLGVIDTFQKGDVAPADMPQALTHLLRRLRLLPDAPETAASPLVGGRYQLGRQLGKGGMGLVHEARHIQLGRPFALKTISPQYALDAAARARFNQEARLASEIVHPNIVSVLDYGEDRNLGPYMVMELMSGPSLAELATTQLTLRRACDLLGQVVDAVTQIHARGIVHGDIKAENILVVEDHVGARRRRVAKLLDFGLARRISSMQTTSDLITGTPHYIAPERTSGAPATLESDIYALGVLGYLLLAGSLPFDGTATEIMLSHVRNEPDPISTRRGEPVDNALQALISRAMSKDLVKRHPSATAFRYELNNTLDMLELSNRTARIASRGTL